MTLTKQLVRKNKLMLYIQNVINVVFLYIWYHMNLSGKLPKKYFVFVETHFLFILNHCNVKSTLYEKQKV